MHGASRRLRRDSVSETQRLARARRAKPRGRRPTGGFIAPLFAAPLRGKTTFTFFRAARPRLFCAGGGRLECGRAPDLCFHSDAVVLTAGTFLGGVIHVGKEAREGGRAGDAAAGPLAEQLREINPVSARLKTGTPPRLDGRSIDFSKMEEQPGDEPRPVFSFLGSADEHPPQISCHVANTNAKAHDVVRAALGDSPMFSGRISRSRAAILPLHRGQGASLSGA